MARISNFRRISTEDYQGEYQQLIEKIALNLNPFMQEVVDVVNGRLDFDNLQQNVITANFQVNSNGVPIGTNQLNTQGINQPRGFQVISARNTQNSADFPSGQPFISFTPQGNSIVQINNISNLTANQTYQLTIIVY